MIKKKRKLKKQVEGDKQHIKEFLKTHNLKLYNNRVSLLYSHSYSYQLEDSNAIVNVEDKFHPLWEVYGKPTFLKLQLAIDLTYRNQTNKFLKQQGNLLYKTLSRAWPDNPTNPQGYKEECKNICKHDINVTYD